ncbi:hypothetical protein [Phyllobacterium sp. K27]
MPQMAFPGTEASQAERAECKIAGRAVFGSLELLQKTRFDDRPSFPPQAIARRKSGRGKEEGVTKTTG